MEPWNVEDEVHEERYGESPQVGKELSILSLSLSFGIAHIHEYAAVRPFYYNRFPISLGSVL